MSYSFMVFKKEAAPKTRKDFLNWYKHQTEWTEKHNYTDLANTSIELQNWFIEMIKTFPALKDPFTNNEDDKSVFLTDYIIGKDIIYAVFSRQKTEQAYDTGLQLAKKYQVGFFDISSLDKDILFPFNGTLITLENMNLKRNFTMSGENKPWWKFW